MFAPLLEKMHFPKAVSNNDMQQDKEMARLFHGRGFVILNINISILIGYRLLF